MDKNTNVEFKSEAKLTFAEATGIIIGHGVGAGILSVPYIASKGNWWDFIWIILLACCVSLLLHLMIAELSYNNQGAMFVKCLGNLFSEKARSVVIAITAICLGFSVIVNCSAYVSGGAEAVQTLISIISGGYILNTWIAALIFYLLCAVVVFFGMKIVGICEKYCVYGMVGVLLTFTVASLIRNNPQSWEVVSSLSAKNILGLFGMISFALSAVMSVPQVVKGLNGDKKKIVASISTGIGVTGLLITVLTLTTIFTCGSVALTKSQAIENLSGVIGYEWLGVIGALFSIFALATSFWANSLDLRDIVMEHSKLNAKLAWLCVSAPALIMTIVAMLDFVDLTAIAGAVQIVTALGIVIAFRFSRKRAGGSPLIGVFGSTGFQIAVLVFNLLATIGEFLVLSIQ